MHETVCEALLIGGRAGVGKTTVGWEVSGYRRLIYTNTVSVLEADLIARAMGGAPRITSVLLTAGDATAR